MLCTNGQAFYLDCLSIKTPAGQSAYLYSYYTKTVLSYVCSHVTTKVEVGFQGHEKALQNIHKLININTQK